MSMSKSYLQTRVFWAWIVDGIVESVLCCILSFYFLSNFDYRTGQLSSYLEAASLCFTILIIQFNLKVAALVAVVG